VSEAVTGLLRAMGLSWSFDFDAEHVTVINAGTIILLQVLVSRIVRDRPALPTMVTGMTFGAAGFLLLASSRSAWIFILGIAVFSIGEMTAHPKYYSFVGTVAPADRKAVYMATPSSMASSARCWARASARSPTSACSSRRSDPAPTDAPACSGSSSRSST